MMKNLLSITLVVALALAGCLGDIETDSVTDVDMLLAENTSGPAPLSVTFTLNNGDPDVDWTFDLGDGETLEGTGLPQTVEHVYTEPGNHTAVFTIEDETRWNASVTIYVTGSLAAQEYAGGWQASTPVYCAIVGPVNADLSGLMTDSTTVSLETIGKGFEAEFTSAVEAGVVEYTVAFVDTDDDFTLVESHTGGPGEVITGKVPDDADEVHFSACGVTGPVTVAYQAG